MSHAQRVLLLLTTLLAVCAAPGAPATAATAATPWAAPKAAVDLPAPSMAGVNNWSCKPTAAHPRPVVLVHGTADSQQAWSQLAPILVQRGYCVFALDYGSLWFTAWQVNAFGPVRQSALQVRDFIEKVRANTHASKIDYVGHSQGGMIGLYYAKNLGLASRVQNMVLLSPVTHGTTLGGAVEFADMSLIGRPVIDLAMGLFCPACVDMERGSTFVRALNDGRIPQPGVSYTIISTKDDDVVTPPESQFILDDPLVTNRWVQDECPGTAADHGGMPSHPVAVQMAVNALDPTHAEAVAC